MSPTGDRRPEVVLENFFFPAHNEAVAAGAEALLSHVQSALLLYGAPRFFCWGGGGKKGGGNGTSLQRILIEIHVKQSLSTLHRQ